MPWCRLLMQTTSMLLGSSGRLVGIAWMNRPGKSRELEVAPHQLQLGRGGAAHDHRRAVLSVLHPVGPQAVTQAEKRVAGVLGEFEQASGSTCRAWNGVGFRCRETIAGSRVRVLRERRTASARAGAIRGNKVSGQNRVDCEALASARAWFRAHPFPAAQRWLAVPGWGFPTVAVCREKIPPWVPPYMLALESIPSQLGN